jgi:hypothetical protein
VSAAALLAELRAGGAELAAEAGGLRVRAAEALPPALLARVRALKPELLALLSPPAPVDHQVEQLPAAPPTPASRPQLPRPPGAAPLDYLDTVERDGLLVLGPIRGRAPLASPSTVIDPGRAAAWREAHARRLAAGFDPESAARLTSTTHGPRPA